MFGRRARSPRNDDGARPGESGGLGLGIGALVQVVDTDRGGEQWADEPIGVIVAPGGVQLGGTQRTWTVAFDEPAYTKDGRGPFERATVLGRQLVPVGPAAADEV
ncbi:hypothetical protein QUG98_11990 [Curtobacterium sp. RHCJP20]|uniref:Uncharacterized protein n=1 Tax=Curtobacterium subtropicum TaxID=3055138 RepID=A0ABT7TJY5_9MICO|nr:hypothetical protein [Curtobacterium subtropicum]MDM7889169.1 hypothetical protein [Curtobacterium subtropicum]